MYRVTKSIPPDFTIKGKYYLVVGVDVKSDVVTLKCEGKYIEMNYYKLVERLEINGIYRS